MPPQPGGSRKCFSKFCQIPKHGFSCYRNKQTYFSLAKKKKKVLIVRVPILIDKYLFEPSYHDLKGFPGSSVSEESACKARDARNASLIPG